jgi:hypothetical protein
MAALVVAAAMVIHGTRLPPEGVECNRIARALSDGPMAEPGRDQLVVEMPAGSGRKRMC